MGKKRPRLVVRPDDRGRVDDIVVEGVKMFRAEDMGDSWWVCCYLTNGESIEWNTPKGRWVQVEMPLDYENWDTGELANETSQAEEG